MFGSDYRTLARFDDALAYNIIMKVFPSSRFSAPAFRLFYFVASATLAGGQSRAASDTDVYVNTAKSVIIEKEKITIVAEAETTKINIFVFAPPAKTEGIQKVEAPDGASKDQAALPKTPIGYTNRRTFIIRRPILKFNDPKGTHAKERAQSQKTLDDAWEMSLAAAKDLRDGKRVGRIGYYRPTFLTDSIDGFGYLYPETKPKAEHDGGLKGLQP